MGTRSDRIKSSSDTSPASDTAVEDTPAGIAEPVTRWCTSRRWTPSARRSTGQR